MSIARRVREYLKNRPYILEALEKGIVNLSALSREVSKELNIDSLVAVKAALRRYAEELRKRKRKREERVLRVLKESRIKLESGMNILITKELLDLKSKLALALDNVYVYLIGKDERIPKRGKITLHKDCGMFIITSPPEIEEVPGVVAYLTSLLAEQNINVIEFISCYTTTILLVKKQDILKTYEILSKVVG